MPVFNDLQQDHARCIVKGLQAKIVQYKQVILLHFGNFPAIGSVCFHHFQSGEQLLCIEVQGPVTQLTCLVAEG